MKTPQEWIDTLLPGIPSEIAYAAVNAEARKYLTTLDHGDVISTSDLVEALFPVGLSKQSEGGMAARQRIVDALTNKYTERFMGDCFVLAPPQLARTYGKRRTIRRRLWHPPTPPVVTLW